jgi:Icc-related predicted phosphoesterase
MKIVGMTDIHGAYMTAGEIVRDERPDLLILGGDLTTVGTVAEAETALEMLGAICGDILCVAGNMDTPHHDAMFSRRGFSINGVGVRRGPVGFFGVSSAPVSLLRTPYEMAEEDLRRLIDRGHAMIADAPIKVFVPHAPPYGTKLDIVHAGYHVGSTAVRDAIEEFQPDLVICGHIHEGRGVDRIDKSRIVNCGTAARGCYAIVGLSQEKDAADFSIELRQHLPGRGNEHGKGTDGGKVG